MGRLRSSLLAVLLLESSPWLAAQTTWYVDPKAPPPGNGSQSQPYSSIQYAISQPTTLDGDTLLAFPGTYLERIDFLGKALELRSLAGAALTTIDGGGPGSVVTIPDPLQGVVLLQGFRITGGEADPLGPSRGGGIRCLGDQATIADCLVEGNVADTGAGIDLGLSVLRDSTVRGNFTRDFQACFFFGNGGGVYGGTRIERCDIVGNGALNLGGGIETTGLVVDCLIEDNRAQIGGGVYGGTLSGCTLRGNSGASCDFSGGGGGGASNAVLDQCLLEGNLAESWGGGAADSTLSDCVVRDNLILFPFQVSRNGGAGLNDCVASDCEIRGNIAPPGHPVFLVEGGGASKSVLTRCIVRENEADHGGGAFGGSVLQCTLIDNLARVAGGGLDGSGCNSSVVRDNLPDNVVGWGGIQGVTFSNVEGGFTGPGNFDLDPRFCQRSEGDLHLKPDSPCIDAGDPNAPPDPDGSRADVGALPYDPSWCGGGCLAVYCSSETNSAGCAPALVGSGEPTFGGGAGLEVRAQGLINQQAGTLLWGLQPRSTPFLGGTLCISAPLVRTSVQGTQGNVGPPDCSGTLAFVFDPAYLALQGLGPGTIVRTQVWSRDPGDPDASNLSNALEFTVCP